MPDWKDFHNALAREVEHVFVPIATRHKKELGRTILNSLMDEPGPRHLRRRSTERELFYRRLFEGFVEIHSSLESMKNTEISLRRFPFRGTRISLPSYLQYHVENYINEVYILEQRILSYLTKLGREFRGDARHAEILAATRPLFRLVDESLKGIVNTRGRHVHERRYTDEDLGRLELMHLLTSDRTGIDEFVTALTPFYRAEHRRIRAQWRTRVQRNNEVLVQLLDLCAAKLLPILFAPDTGRLNYPSNLKAT